MVAWQYLDIHLHTLIHIYIHTHTGMDSGNVRQKGGRSGGGHGSRVGQVWQRRGVPPHSGDLQRYQRTSRQRALMEILAAARPLFDHRHADSHVVPVGFVPPPDASRGRRELHWGASCEEAAAHHDQG